MWNSVRKRIVLIVIPFFWIVTSALFSSSLQAQNPRGSLLVAVQDSSGARIAGASISVTQEKFALSRSAKADAQGETRFESLLPGSYTVTVDAAGFAEKKTAVVVAVSSQPVLVVTLKPQTVEESVEVRDRGPSLASQPIETTSSTIKTVITSSDLDEVPLATRSFANISYLAPFTAPVEPSDPTKARITAVSFGGSSGLNVDLSVDGGDNNDDYIGGFLQNFSPESVQEFVVRTSQFGADTSRTNGGSVIISTRRGTDDWHGSASYYYRGSGLNARNVLDNPEPNPKQPFSRQNGVAALGGPLKAKELWFFTSYEYIDENSSVAYSAHSLSEFNALAQMAAAGDLPNASSIGAIPSSAPVPFRDTLFSARTDWMQSSRSQWFARGSLDRNHTQHDLLQQGALPSTGATGTSNYYNLLVNDQLQFSPSWLGTLTLEASGFHHTKVRNSNIGEAFNFPFTVSFLTTSGLETFGDNQFATAITAFPIQRDQQKYQFRYDVSRAVGRHAARFGVNLIHEPVLRGELASNVETVYSYPRDYRKAIAPRLGIAYAPQGSSTTVFRAGAGLYYNDLAQNGWVRAFQAVNKDMLNSPFNGQGALIDPNYHTPYALTASAGYEHAFHNDWRLSVTYEHQQGVHQYRRYEYTPGFSLPPTAPSISLFRTDNRSIYNGVALQMQHSFAQHFELTANYVLAHATTWGATVGELFDYVNGVSNVLHPFGPGDHGPSGEDIRHRFVLVGVLQLPWKLEVSTLGQFESARPYTMMTPVDVNHDGVTGNDRAVVNGVQTALDQFRGSPFSQVDLRISRNLVLRERATLRPFVEFFNLFNRQNPGNNYVPDISALPTPVNDPLNATSLCLDPPACTQNRPIRSLNQLRTPAGALGDFFGPGTTVGIPFAAQIGLRLSF